MHRPFSPLAVRLVLAFLATTLLTVVLILLLFQQINEEEIEQIFVRTESESFAQMLTEYYQREGTWEGVREFIRPPGAPPPAPRPPGNPPAPSPTSSGGGRLLLVDSQGIFIAAAGRYAIGDPAPPDAVAQGIPIVVEGERVGTVLIPPERPSSVALAQIRAFRELANRALGGTFLVAVPIALLLALVLTWTLLRPVQELTTAVRAMAGGNLAQRVPVRGSDEVGELAQAFNQMSAELERATRQRHQMTADIAHDLRTPLQVIAGYIESMRDGVLASTPTRLSTIYGEIEHLERLVNDLLTLARADAGELRLMGKPLDPGTLLTDVVARFADEAKRQSVRLTIDVPPHLPAVPADEARLMQVLNNLMNNALRHTPAGGEVTLAARVVGSTMEFSIRDTGDGIPPDALPHIFDRGFQVDAARTGDTGAAGLGLAISRALAEAHGGTLDAHSSGIGQGAIFTLTLPLTVMTT